MSFQIKTTELIQMSKFIASKGKDADRNEIALTDNFMLEVKDDKTVHVRSVDNSKTCCVDLTFKVEKDTPITSGKVPIENATAFLKLLESAKGVGKEDSLLEVSFNREGVPDDPHPVRRGPHVQIRRLDAYTELSLPVFQENNITSYLKALPSYNAIDMYGAESDGVPVYKGDLLLSTSIKINPTSLKRILKDADTVQAATYPFEILKAPPKPGADPVWGVRIVVASSSGVIDKFFVAEITNPFTCKGKSFGYGFDNFMSIANSEAELCVSSDMSRKSPAIFKLSTDRFFLYYMVSYVKKKQASASDDQVADSSEAAIVDQSAAPAPVPAPDSEPEPEPEPEPETDSKPEPEPVQAPVPAAEPPPADDAPNDEIPADSDDFNPEDGFIIHSP